MFRRFVRLTLIAAVAASALCAAAPVSRSEGPTKREVQSSVDRAVDRGLKYLGQQQNKNGSWGEFAGTSTAVTSLAVMAFMSRGHLPGEGEYGEQLNKGIDFVLDQQREDGLIGPDTSSFAMYCHGISTVMLCEAYAMVSGKTAKGVDRQKAVETAVSRAVRLILTSQQLPKAANARGGWRYLPNSMDSDISVSGWQLMALRGAGNIGANIPKRALDEGLAYILARRTQDGGFSYEGNTGDSTARTGTGVLAIELLGKHGTKEAIDGGKYILDAVHDKHNGGFEKQFYYYGIYYCSQAANQLGGIHDEQINGFIRNSLLASQRGSGAWAPASGEAWSTDTYATSMAILALTVQHHYLPLYQR